MARIDPIVDAAAITPALGVIFARLRVVQNETHDRRELSGAVAFLFKFFSCPQQYRKTFLENLNHFIRIQTNSFIYYDLLILDGNAVIPRFGMTLQRGFHAGGLFGQNQLSAGFDQRNDPIDAFFDLVSLRDFFNRPPLPFASKVVARLACFCYAFVEKIGEAFAVGVVDWHFQFSINFITLAVWLIL